MFSHILYWFVHLFLTLLLDNRTSTLRYKFVTYFLTLKGYQRSLHIDLILHYFYLLKYQFLIAVFLNFSIDEDIRLSKSEIHGSDYHLVDADLSILSQVEKKLHESGIDKNLPTLFMAECVLVYIDNLKTKELLKWIADQFPVAMFINYEQVRNWKPYGISLKVLIYF